MNKVFTAHLWLGAKVHWENGVQKMLKQHAAALSMGYCNLNILYTHTQHDFNLCVLCECSHEDMCNEACPPISAHQWIFSHALCTVYISMLSNHQPCPIN